MEIFLLKHTPTKVKTVDLSKEIRQLAVWNLNSKSVNWDVMNFFNYYPG